MVEPRDMSCYDYYKACTDEYGTYYCQQHFGKWFLNTQIIADMDALAAYMRIELGLQPGDVYSVFMPTTVQSIVAFYALNKIGAVSNMIHPLAGEQEILHYLNEVQSEVAVLFEGTYNIIKDSIGQTKVKHAVVVSAGESLPFGIRQLYFLKSPRAKLPKPSVYQSWKDFLDAGANTAAPSVQKDPRTMALISHTGGTTGEPKGVMCSDYNINALIYQSYCCFDHHERQHRSLVVLPPFINYSLIQSMLEMLYLGYTVILLPKYEPNEIKNYIRQYEPNVILSIPPYWEMLLDSSDTKTVDMSCFEQIYYGGEAMSEDTESAVNLVLKQCGSKIALLKGLGSTELMAVASQTYPWCNDVGSVGIPLVKMNCKIVDLESSEENPVGKKGEICFSGPTLMLGYYNNPEATNEIVKTLEDGQRWLHTGDIGYIDEDGVIYVTGRIKRILATKGKDGVATKLFPDRIEKAIYQHPAVELCCVIGIPDKERINYPKAFVVLNGEGRNRETVTEEILKICREGLPDYMVPDEIEYRSELPRTSRGKVDYRALEQMAKGM